MYPPQQDTFDELVASDGSVRPHWQNLLKQFESLDATQRRLAHETAARMLKDDGMTYLSTPPGSRNRRTNVER